MGASAGDAEEPAPSAGRRNSDKLEPGPFVAAFRFDPKTERRIAVSEARAAMDDGEFLWIDLDLRDDSTLGVIQNLGLMHPEALEDAMSQAPATQVARYEAQLHIAVTATRLSDKSLDLDRVDIVIAKGFLLTLHRSAPHFLRKTRRHYLEDFRQFARSPSFLLYELWDHLIDNYLQVQKKFEERVESLQSVLRTEADDKVFIQISELGADLLHFRKVLLPARAVLTDLSTRKSPFISEATQPFLGNMVGTIERVLQDLLVDRDILSESLNLYMSLVSYRTNRVMNRLTVVSVIFLPLTFLCGVYGMNFEVIPELKWPLGYAGFWVLALTIAAGLGLYMRRLRLL
ncbi:MAG: magnesium transporter CorA family protein [Polyangiaceae bacterium]|nr:magnesium transporter CorA family protein [Polyangiaceae bacterium]